MVNYVVPKTLNEAVKAMLSKSTVLGGGTLEMPKIAATPHNYNNVIDLSALSLDTIKTSGDAVTLGAGVTLAQLRRARGLGFIGQAAGAIGGPALRNSGTIGGNIVYGGDLIPALLVLNAKLDISKKSGKSKISVEDFVRGRAQKNTLISKISFKRPSGRKFGYYKFARRQHNTASLVASAVCQDGQGGSLIGLSGMADRPELIKLPHDIFSKKFTQDDLVNALTPALKAIKFKTDYHGTGAYRKMMVPVIVRRSIDESKKVK